MKSLLRLFTGSNGANDATDSQSSLLRHLITCSVGTAIAKALAIAGLITWEHAPILGTGPFTRSSVLYTMPTEIGLIIFLYCAALSVILLFTTVDAWLRYAICYRSKRAVYIIMTVRCVLCGSYIAVTVACLMLWATDVLQCGLIFCLGAKYSERKLIRGRTGLYFHVNLAIMFFCALVPFSLLGLYHTFRLWQIVQKLSFDELSARAREEENSNNGSVDRTVADVNRLHTNMMPTHFPRSMFAQTVMRVRRTPSTRSRLVKLLIVITVLLCFACVTFYMPSSTTWVFSAQRIAQLASLRPTIGIVDSKSTSPELLNAVFRTHGIRISDALCLKMYPGNVFFFGYLILTLLLLWVLQFNPKLRHIAHRRLTFYPSMTLYELVCLVLTALLVALFTFYWMHDHNYKGIWRAGKPVQGYLSLVEVFARGWGQVALLFMSLLLFPISKQSIVFKLVGISSETFLPLHRILGYAMLGATAIHAILFYIRFYQQGTLKHNLLHTPTKISIRQHRSDYTVIAVTGSSVLLFLSMGLLALNSVRRRFYELFYYSHLIAAHASIPIILWHAASGWELLLPGLTLWLADMVMQYNQSSALVLVRQACVIAEDMVELQFQVAWPATVVHPGQYVMVNIAEVSVLQWHPFTLSSVAACCSTTQSKTAATRSDSASDSAVIRNSSADTHTMVESRVLPSMYVDAEGKLVYEPQSCDVFSPCCSNNDTLACSWRESSREDMMSENASAAACVDGALTVHIKVMAPNSWTDRLYRRVAAGQPLTMSVKGPCGAPLDLTAYNDVFLVCGGIGVTPCASIFGSLLRQRLHKGPCASVPPVRVRLIWATRSAAIVMSMAKILCLPCDGHRLFESSSFRASDVTSDPHTSSKIVSARINHFTNATRVAREDAAQPTTSSTPTATTSVRVTTATQEFADSSTVPDEMDDICRQLQSCFQCRVFFTTTESYREGCRNWPFASVDASGEEQQLTLPPQQSTNQVHTRGAGVPTMDKRKDVAPHGVGATEISINAPCRAQAHALTSLSISFGRPDFLELESEIDYLVRDPESSFRRERAIFVTCGASSMMQDVVRTGARAGIRVETHQFEL